MISHSHDIDPQFTYPLSEVISMVFALCLIGGGGYFFYSNIAPVFLANPYLNAVIISVFFVGLGACFGQIWQLTSSINWIIGFTQERLGQEQIKAPRLLTTMARLLSQRGSRKHITPASTRSILDSTASRIDEMRTITRYIVNLLIFLGLLGTFFGLATIIPAVVDTIRSIAPQPGEDSVFVFNRLIKGLETQLGGMGTAFASSLLGLAGSLIVGLLELFATHGQNRFYRELEDWLSSITRLGVSSGNNSLAPGNGGNDRADYINAFEQMCDQITEQTAVMRRLIDVTENGRQITEQTGAMHRLIDDAENGRQRTDQHIERLTDAIAHQINAHTDAIAHQINAHTEVSEQNKHQTEALLTIHALLEKNLNDMQTKDKNLNDMQTKDNDIVRRSLLNIETRAVQMIEEFPATLHEVTQVLRGDLANLTNEISKIQASSPKKKD